MSCVNKSNKDYIRLAERYGDTIAESIVRTISKTKGLVEEFHIPSILEAKKFLKTANSNKLQKIKKGLKANPYLTEKGIVDYLQGVVSKFENQYYVVKGFSYGITSKEAAAKEIFEPNLEIVKTIASEYPDIFKIQETGKEQTVIVKITPKKQFLEIVTPPTIEQGKLFQEAGRATQEVKPGVQELFESNPELATIGTQQQYSQYLDTIFPDSKVKDILYHASPVAGIEEVIASRFGIYLSYSPVRTGAFGYNIYAVIINAKNLLSRPKREEASRKELEEYNNALNDFYSSYSDPQKPPVYQYDSAIESSTTTNEGIQIKVRTSEQARILGSKQDIEGFKEFVGKEEVELSPEEMYQKSLDLSDKEIEDRINKCRL